MLGELERRLLRAFKESMHLTGRVYGEQIYAKGLEELKANGRLHLLPSIGPGELGMVLTSKCSPFELMILQREVPYVLRTARSFPLTIKYMIPAVRTTFTRGSSDYVDQMIRGNTYTELLKIFYNSGKSVVLIGCALDHTPTGTTAKIDLGQEDVPDAVRAIAEEVNHAIYDPIRTVRAIKALLAVLKQQGPHKA